MVLNKTPRWFYLLVGFLALVVLALGAWWLYLLTVFAKMIGPTEDKVVRMLMWEGSTFLVLLTSSAVSVAVMYWRDLRKTSALQALFASLTHELKTPLASMRLQAEVIRDLIADESHDHDQLTALTTRLIQDTSKFEHELDKGLQLSRVEGQGTLTLSPVDLGRFVRKLATKHGLTLEVTGNGVVLADEMALTMVFRNLFENTARHNLQGTKATVSFQEQGDALVCSYDDHGKVFAGDRKMLGELFYKHDSKKGTGIGLYLVKQLMKAQQGKLSFSQEGPLVFFLEFRRGEELA
jgi:signal transduction histidine kinase